MPELNTYVQFERCIQDLIDTPSVQAMSGVTHHVDVNCLEHCLYVSYVSFLLSRFFPIGLPCRCPGWAVA